MKCLLPICLKTFKEAKPHECTFCISFPTTCRLLLLHPETNCTLFLRNKPHRAENTHTRMFNRASVFYFIILKNVHSYKALYADWERQSCCRTANCQITDCTRVALMSKSLEMFSLCHIPLVDLGQRFLCNLAAITKKGCTGKTQWAFCH